VTTFYVARNKSTGTFAKEGRETGMGCVIEQTPDVSRAKFCTSAVGIMVWMGGHYRGYEAVRLTVSYTLGEVEPFPPEADVFPEDRR
jgi:hypothetical protein